MDIKEYICIEAFPHERDTAATYMDGRWYSMKDVWPWLTEQEQTNYHTLKTLTGDVRVDGVGMRTEYIKRGPDIDIEVTRERYLELASKLKDQIA